MLGRYSLLYQQRRGGELQMIITLTDKDGIRFDVNTLVVDEVYGSPSGTKLKLSTGETITCKESASKVMQMIVAAQFGGAI